MCGIGDDYVTTDTFYHYLFLQYKAFLNAICIQVIL